MPAQQEAVRGETEHTKLNQAFIFRLVKHNATLFSDFFTKTRSDCSVGGLGWGALTEVTNNSMLLTRESRQAHSSSSILPQGEQAL